LAVVCFDIGAAFFDTGAAFFVTGVAFFFSTVTAFFFGAGVFFAGFTGRVWRVAAGRAVRGRAFAADFAGRAVFCFAGFATRVGLTDLRWLAIVTPPYR
jgi:hypothetical protein